MKIIEILAENEKADWATIQGYTPNSMSNQVTDQESAKSFYNGPFRDELDKVLSLLDAWNHLAFDTGYASKEAKQAKRDVADIITAMNSNTALTELHVDNLAAVKKKLENAGEYFHHIAQSFNKAGRQDMYMISLKVHHALYNVANEIKATKKSNAA